MKIAQIWRHPIKSHGREALDRVMLTKGQTMPFDRVWAIAHEAAKVNSDDPAWAACANFSRGSKAPSLMAINSQMDEATNVITLTHPNLPTISINLDTPEGANEMIDWVKPICPTERAQPATVYKVPNRGLTDSDFPSVTINSMNSLQDLSDRIGTEVSQLRFRGNLWIENAEPWAELDWVGQTIQIGEARLKVIERTERCTATSSNPVTGDRDIDMIKTLKDNWGHQDFGVRAEVIRSGSIQIGDPVQV